MSWYSILPGYLTVYETWAIRIFVSFLTSSLLLLSSTSSPVLTVPLRLQLILGILNLSPWLIAIIFDIMLYIFRTIYHIIPVYGGRARGETRPRAPTVRHARDKSLSLVGVVSGRVESVEEAEEREKSREEDGEGDGASDELELHNGTAAG